MGVVPLARSGGSAAVVWTEMLDDLGAFEVGGQPIDRAVFERLDVDDIEVAVDAAVQLISQAMYLPRDSA